MKSELSEPGLINLRPGSATDITSLHRSAFDAEELWHSIFAAPGVDALIEEMLLDPEQYFLGARFGGLLAGYAQVRIIESGPHLNNIAVSPNYQGSGVGSALLRRIMETSVEQGYAQMTLDVADNRKQAREWYRKCGFQDVSVVRTYTATRRGDRSAEEADVIWTDDQKKRRDKFGISTFNIRISDQEFCVGQISSQIFRVGVPHNQDLVDALHKLDPRRKIIVSVPDSSRLKCDAEQFDETIRMACRL